MEQLKVKKKETIIINVVVYLMLSFFFVYIQHAYRHHLSPFSLTYLEKGIELFWYVACVLGLSAILVWKHHKHSIIFFQLSVLLVSFKVLEGLFISFNKIIVIALFCYIVISYFLYQLIKFYSQTAYLNANYHHSDLFKPLLRDIQCKIHLNETIVDGTLSNWDSEGCFFKVDKPLTLPAKVEISVHLYNREFKQNGEVVAEALDLTGFGVKFERRPKDLNLFNWAEFIELVDELGFQAERLR